MANFGPLHSAKGAETVVPYATYPTEGGRKAVVVCVWRRRVGDGRTDKQAAYAEEKILKNWRARTLVMVVVVAVRTPASLVCGETTNTGTKMVAAGPAGTSRVAS